MSEPVLKITRDGHVVILTMNRPDSLNAMNVEMVEAMHDALDEIASDFPVTRAVVLTGTGRGFCAGADMRALANSVDQPARPRPQRTLVGIGPKIWNLPQPVIAAMNGVAAGAGLSFALACDIRIASTLARYSCVFVKRAMVPDAGASYTLPQLVGPAIAAEMALTGRVYDADWGARVGLSDGTVDPEQLLTRATDLALEVASAPPAAVSAAKRLLHRHAPVLDDVSAAELDANDELRDTEDRREAILSFVEKRAPVYSGR